jgi:hypothetical protein
MMDWHVDVVLLNPLVDINYTWRKLESTYTKYFGIINPHIRSAQGSHQDLRIEWVLILTIAGIEYFLIITDGMTENLNMVELLLTKKCPDNLK